MSVVFLDIDGVLNRGAGPLEPACVAVLNEITDTTGAEIVIHSSRRYFLNLSSLRTLLEEAGVRANVLGLCPCPEFKQTSGGILVPDESFRVFIKNTGLDHWVSSERPAAVLHYLEEHPTKEFVILDDAPDFEETKLENRVVRTTAHLGLTQNDGAKAIAILRGSH